MDQHHVPQFLLRAWGDGNPNGKVVAFRLDLAEVTSRSLAPRSTGYETDAWTLTSPIVAGEDEYVIETKTMQSVDDDAAKVRAKLMAKGVQSLTAEERCDWARFLTSLRARQPVFVEKIKSVGKSELLSHLAADPDQYLAIVGADDPPTLIEWAEKRVPGLIENFGLTNYPSLIDHADLVTKIINLRWLLLDVGKARYELLLSDNPCISIGKIDDPEVVITLPISPTRVFVACGGAQTAQNFIRAHPDKLVMLANESAINQASKRVYARTEDPGRFIENRVTKLRRERALHVAAKS